VEGDIVNQCQMSASLCKVEWRM